MSGFAKKTEQFVTELDAAVEAHMGWTRRVLRCAVLKQSPGEDVIAPDAHLRCRFGRWATQYRESFTELNAEATERLFDQHQRMHEAIRTLCTDLLSNGVGQSQDLDVFETTQSALLGGLAHFKTNLLAHSARVDALTGLPLRYGLETEFERGRAMAQRNGLQLLVVLCDVDHFKKVNDTYGHAVGDMALRHVAHILSDQTRAGDKVFRFGGEEFLLLLQAAEQIGAEQACQRLLQALRDTPLQRPDNGLLALRMSAGIAFAGQDESMAQAVERADKALYQAKQQGRDRWVWAQPIETPDF